MTTAALTLANFNDKFFGIQQYVTPAVLDLINKSETLKAQIRSYEGDENVQAVVLDGEKPGAASYTIPVPAQQNQPFKFGFATFGLNRINTPEGFIQVVSHELGHYAVENPGATIANARANTAVTQNVAGYEAACHLTEGYARLATAKVIAEIEAQSGASVTLAKLISAGEYVQYKALLPGAAETSWTAADLDNALAFALGESNKINMASTSTTPETYLEYCSKSANSVIHTGASAPAGSAPAAVLGNEVDSQGVVTQSVGTFDAGDHFVAGYSETVLNGYRLYASVNAQGSSRSESYAADGSVTTHWQTSDGSHGDETTDALGNFSESGYAADGTYSTASRNADGSHSDYVRRTDGSIHAENWGADGFFGQTTTNADGSSFSDYRNADGSHGNSSYDGLGNSQSEAYSADGGSTHDWARSDGASYHDTTDALGNYSESGYAADGTYSNAYRNTDGSHSNYVRHPDGSSHTENWGADGFFAQTTTNADGSSFSDYRNADGGHGSSSYDGLGSSQTESHNADGSVRHEWAKMDGSSHWDSTDALGDYSEAGYASDGTYSNAYSNSDGSHSSYVRHPDGSSHTENWGADGFFAQMTTNADGSSFSNSNGVDGSYGSSSYDGQGNSQSETHNADGSARHEWANADGSSHWDTTDAQGNFTESTHAADGTYSSFSGTSAMGSIAGLETAPSLDAGLWTNEAVVNPHDAGQANTSDWAWESYTEPMMAGTDPSAAYAGVLAR